MPGVIIIVRFIFSYIMNRSDLERQPYLPSGHYSFPYEPRNIASPPTKQNNANLPVIYGSPDRNRSQSRHQGSSRVIYEPRDSRSRQPKIVVNETAKNLHSVSPGKFVNMYESQQKQNSRIIVHHQPVQPIAPPPRQVIHYYQPSEMPHHNFMPPTRQSEIRFQQMPRVNTSIPVSNNSNSNSRITSHISTESVPRIQYDRCVIECKNWETKYNELYLKFLNLNSKIQQPSPYQARQMEDLREQNRMLRKELEQQKSMTKKMTQTMENNFTEMVERQRQATFKELQLLVDRYRLQSRHGQ